MPPRPRPPRLSSFEPLGPQKAAPLPAFQPYCTQGLPCSRSLGPRPTPDGAEPGSLGRTGLASGCGPRAAAGRRRDQPRCTRLGSPRPGRAGGEGRRGVDAPRRHPRQRVGKSRAAQGPPPRCPNTVARVSPRQPRRPCAPPPPRGRRRSVARLLPAPSLEGVEGWVWGRGRVWRRTRRRGCLCGRAQLRSPPPPQPRSLCLSSSLLLLRAEPGMGGPAPGRPGTVM